MNVSLDFLSSVVHHYFEEILKDHYYHYYHHHFPSFILNNLDSKFSAGSLKSSLIKNLTNHPISGTITLLMVLIPASMRICQF